ncbi:RNA polymerase sigma factor [Actinoplanes rectilineatus]|nr:sigma-70 family RNA polymerase sigma factor [Actinoplanes rectilineatus]GLY00511.1 RNA polymerase sigma factor [Actinoplanes sp. NBRC 101535]
MAGWQDTSDEDLVKRIRAGERDAWQALVRRYSGRLWAVARGMRLRPDDAADAVQTTWLRLVERLDDLREPDRVGGWLTTTMRRQCLDTLARRQRVIDQDRFDELPGPSEPLDRHLLRTERDAALWRAFRSLGPRCETLLRLLLADPPPSYALVSVTLDMPIGSIGPTRQRCLARLREVLAAGPYPL